MGEESKVRVKTMQRIVTILQILIHPSYPINPPKQSLFTSLLYLPLSPSHLLYLVEQTCTKIYANLTRQLKVSQCTLGN